MSQGILTYYFKNKNMEEILFEMVRYANRLLMDDVVTRLRRANSNWSASRRSSKAPEEHYVANTANAWSSFTRRPRRMNDMPCFCNSSIVGFDRIWRWRSPTFCLPPNLIISPMALPR